MSVEPQGGEPLALQAVRLDVSAAGDPPVGWSPLVAELLEPAGITVRSGGDQPASGGSQEAPGVLPLVLRLTDDAGPGAAAGHGAGAPDGVRAGGAATSDERYTLTVSPEGVVVAAPQPVGLLHGVRTLRQLVTADGSVPAVVVRDAPRYPWRGLSVDVVRHWFGPAVLRRVVDLAGAYKLRVLHLHLTDDQGWRIEIPSRPALTERGGRTQVGGELPAGERGYLTVDEFRELQEYAARRFVTVVPEIDLPGHTNAATHAYGELTPDGVPTDAYGGIEVGFSRLWADNPATEPFLRDVLGDVAAMTQGPWVHVGGDEAPQLDVAEYSAIMDLAQRVVREAGKTPVAWQEAARAGIEPGTVLQFWDPKVETGVEPFTRAAEAGARFVASPGSNAYLDMKYTPEHPLGLEWAGHVELRDAYDWEPAEAVPGVPADAVEGVSAAVWTETLTTQDELFSMLLPRLPAVAELAWTTPSGRDWESFRVRVATHAPGWRTQGWSFHPTPQVDWP
ncbi:beta-N-acetylhexosaminidase [Xylanimonas oleitrophica]|uniref:beta-N-acetylhexosaminidase n=1 Tax=Xylanimonas oleitrophica TaxID=2607479 RepID=A0A2W5WSS7_9MICO|nr:beta-N-acetylhexosaminidase [Xylanimonas oleitrophica]